MPELPEVETVARQLSKVMVGRTVESLEVLDSRWCAPLDVAKAEAALIGVTIQRVYRRGKYLLIVGDKATLVSHLRMTGAWLINPDREVGHQRVVLLFSDGTILRYCDVRRFGTGDFFTSEQKALEYLATKLGPEPLDPSFDGEQLRVGLKDRKAPMKSLLLDQKVVAGVGNIYADEALFLAKIHPLREGLKITPAKAQLLSETVVEVLEAGIQAGGATIDDFRHVDGVTGGYQWDFVVHRREGQPCLSCHTTIKRIVVGGRSTYFCPKCQPTPRRSPRK